MNIIGKGRTGVLVYQDASGRTGVVATPDKDISEQLGMFDDLAVAGEIKSGKTILKLARIALFMSDRPAKVRHF
jgi:hypothetical protein